MRQPRILVKYHPKELRLFLDQGILLTLTGAPDMAIAGTIFIVFSYDAVGNFPDDQCMGEKNYAV